MTETQKRIKAYRAALPGLKERVAAVALLLAVSVAMMTSATFAWLTISRNPEMTGVQTNIAANGNLEIALATGTGADAPGKSQVGDSSAAENRLIPDANVTWGNLINLADPSYGLDNLALRPAQLNTAALLTKPLYGAVYDIDGRIKNLTTNYGYTAWVEATNTVAGHFGVSDALGVRAISSIKREQLGFAADYSAMYETAEVANLNAANAYTAITQKQEWLDVLAKLLGIHMTASLNSEDQYKNATITPEDMTALIEMYEAFLDAHTQEADAIAKQLNLELFAAYGGNTAAYTAVSMADVLAIDPNLDSRIKSNGDFSFDVTIDKDGKIDTKTIKITNLKAFLKDYKQLTDDLVTLNTIDAGKDYRWTASGLYKVVERLMDVNKCLIKKQSESSYKTVQQLMSDFSSNPMTALGYRGSKCDIVITNGVLYNLEQRVGSSINIKNMTVTAKMYVNTMNLGEVTANVYAYVTTSATPPSYFAQDLDYAKSLNTGADSSSGDAVAEDTYALAVDLWVRTNSVGSLLTLEGNVLLGDPYQVPVTTQDANGNEVPMYSLTQTVTNEETGETFTNISDVYKKEEGGAVKWYRAVSHTEVTAEELGDAEPVAQVEEKRDVIGYEGENRVWDKNSKDYLTADSTTQGAGSCYVYYADTPEDQARSLELLKHLTVAFVDGNGALLATASMDTENYYGNSGRFVVPLKVNNDGVVTRTVGEDGEEVVEYAITALQQNEATRITAIVYLDGRELGNEDVLSAADIQGQLNIQFGSNTDMEPIDNEELEYEIRRVSATVDNTSFDYDTHVGDMVSTVTVHVDGAEPTNVRAFFQRKINATQGSREDDMPLFTQNGSGDWVSSYKFTAPGEYILRSVYLDGMEYLLDEPPVVKITGFTVASLTCDQITEGRHVDVLTAANSSMLDLKLKFATDDESKLPSKVQGRFLREEDGSAVNVDFTYNATTQIWSGTATFLNSGEYSLEYLVLNGEYVGLDEDKWITANVKLGMKTAVYTTDITSFKFAPDEMVENGTDELQMQVKLMDNGDNSLAGLQNVKLTYRLRNSASTIDVDLTWNAGSGYYEGDLQALVAGPGIWEFYSVTIGDGNTITNATVYPAFEMQAPEPPSFVRIGATGMQYRPDGNAVMTADLKYSATATVAAVFKDAAGNRYPVLGTVGSTDADNVTTWSFTVPTNRSGSYSGKQDGYWTMETIYLWNYYQADGTYVEWKKDESGKLKGELTLNADGSLAANTERDDRNVLAIDVKAENNGSDYSVKVVQTITVTFAQNQSKDFGKDASGNVTGTFMKENTISGITATIRDFTGAVDGIGDVTLTYSYDKKDVLTMGGYTGGDDTYTGFTVTLKQDAADKTKFVQSEAVTIRAAGTYTLTGFQFTMGSGALYNTVPANAPAYTVWSKAPTVSITGALYKSGTENDTSASTITGGVSTTVYHAMSQTEICGIGVTTNYTSARVTITLSGYGSATGAKLAFTTDKSDGKVHLYPEGQQHKQNGTATDSYQWTGDGGCLRYVGWVYQRDNATDNQANAGTLTANTLVMTYGGAEYSFALPTAITISNPSQ